MREKFRVLILGHGKMGHAMEYLLNKNHQLDLWDKYPQDNFQSVKLEEAAPFADIVLFCMPVNPHKSVVQQIKPYLKQNCLCITIAKGLDEDGKMASEIFANELPPQQAYALLYGPMISKEIITGRLAFAQVGCNNLDSFRKIQGLFHSTNLFLEYSQDIVGINWSAILKNVYAILFGIAEQLQLGDNMRGYLSVIALRELRKIIVEMGGQTATSFELAGLGDLITTATCKSSHHHELGCKLARGETDNIQGEGVHTLAMVKQYKLFNIQNYPLFQLINNIVEQPKNIESKIREIIISS